jgi:uncharacterized membrane protein
MGDGDWTKIIIFVVVLFLFIWLVNSANKKPTVPSNNNMNNSNTNATLNNLFDNDNINMDQVNKKINNMKYKTRDSLLSAINNA